MRNLKDMPKSNTKVISIFDTTISEYNLGNQIIMDAVKSELGELFGDYFEYRVPYQQINKSIKHCLLESDYTFFGGTNSLSSFMNKYKQWDINLKKTSFVKDVIMMGIGWWQYQARPNYYTRMILNRALSHNYAHSVRDNYTKKMLDSLGFNTINTGCPTTWKLKEEVINKINASKKAESVIVTLTDYNKSPLEDKKLLDICLNNYSKVYFWPQGLGDLNYIASLNIDKNIWILNSNLEAFDRTLKEQDVDYIGTRLHAGIRALQHKRRSFIVAIDNRATEIGKDINMTVYPRTGIDALEKDLTNKYLLDLKINWSGIEQWKEQFKL
jgi:polysaccharide pyruvyl transferase WcaK-like protein